MITRDMLLTFVRVWQSASSVREVCDHLKLTRNVVNGLRRRCLKAGVPLKTISRVINFDAALVADLVQAASSPDVVTPNRVLKSKKTQGGINI